MPESESCAQQEESKRATWQLWVPTISFPGRLPGQTVQLDVTCVKCYCHSSAFYFSVLNGWCKFWPALKKMWTVWMEYQQKAFIQIPSSSWLLWRRENYSGVCVLSLNLFFPDKYCLIVHFLFFGLDLFCCSSCQKIIKVQPIVWRLI